MELHERIKHLRKDILDMTQEEFGKKLGVSRDVVNNLERGRVEIKDDRIKLIGSVFDVKEYWLQTGEGDIFYSKKADDADIVSDLLEKDNPFFDIIKGIAKTYQKLEPKSQLVIDDFAEELLKELKKGG